MVKLLTRLTEEKRAFEWSPEADTAFKSLKETLCTAPILGYQRPGEKFIVDTDAINVGTGGVLSKVQDGSERFVHCLTSCCVQWQLVEFSYGSAMSDKDKDKTE